MNPGGRRILGALMVAAMALPVCAMAKQPESVISPPPDLSDRVDGALEHMSEPPVDDSPTNIHDQHVDEWTPGVTDGPAPVKSAADWIDNGCWYADADFTAKTRTRANKLIILGTDRNTANRKITARGSFLGLDPGADITLGRYLGRDDDNCDRSVEFTFSGFTSWESRNSLRSTATGSLTSPLPDVAGGFIDADTFTTLYDSTLNSYELNYRFGSRLGRDKLVLQPDGCWRRECDPGATHDLIFGVRAITLDEHFVFESRRLDFPVTQFAGDYFVNTGNTLFGIQAGLDCLHQDCRWSWGVRSKGGIYANFCSQDTNVIETRPITDNGGNVTSVVHSDRSTNSSQVSPAFVGQTGVHGSYQLTPHWTVHSGYDFLLMQGVVLAPEQVNFRLLEPVTKIYSGGWVMVTGLNLGMELVW